MKATRKKPPPPVPYQPAHAVASYWAEVAAAFWDFSAEQGASLILARLAVKRAKEGNFSVLVSCVEVLLSRWRDNPETHEKAVRFWEILSEPAAKRALAEAVIAREP